MASHTRPTTSVDLGGALSHLDEDLASLATASPFRLRGRGALSSVCLVVLLGGFWTPRGTLAQTASSLAQDGEPETVTVSARRRDEPLAKVPESVTVFTAESLAAFDIQSFNDYATKSPLSTDRARLESPMREPLRSGASVARTCSARRARPASTSTIRPCRSPSIRGCSMSTGWRY
jgi:hypothetical protein